MKLKTIFLVGAIHLVLIDLAVQAAPSDLKIIQERIMAELISTEVDDQRVEAVLESQNPDGTWPEINYRDVSLTGFEHRIHTGNMVILSNAYRNPGSRYFGNKKLKEAIESALAHWVEKDYICENWWHNQIGTPNNLVTVMLLVGDEMPRELVKATQPMIGRAHLNASGARPSGDRIKIAGILAKNLLFVQDYQQFAEVVKVIEGEIGFSEGRGMQYDYSFHHREDRVNNTLSYGLGYADAFAEWAAYVAGTEYAFSEEKTEHLVDYYLDGISKSMPYGKYFDTGAKNRGATRPGALKPLNSHTPKKLLEVTDYRKKELEEIIRSREGGTENYKSSHSTFYWHSEHFVFQRPHFYSSVRMFSSRNHNMEVSYNSEGLKNHHRGDGTNHLAVTGEEYYDIFPVMDYQKIPGATILQKELLPDETHIQKKGITDFAGAVTDGLYGAASFDFKSPHDPLEAKKSWFFFDDEYVCLGAGIKASSNNPVVTTLNQNLLLGDVRTGSEGDSKILASGTHQLKGQNWVYSDQVAYVFTKPQDVHVANGPVTGNWRDINKQSSIPTEDVTKDVFKLWIDHGNRPKDATYEYIVVPGIDHQQAAAYDAQSTLTILSNTPQIQAVKHHKLGLYQLVFYKAGQLDLGNGIQFIMDSPGLVMIQIDDQVIKKISVADPSRKTNRMHLSISVPLSHASDGISAVWNEKMGYTELSIDLPQNVYAGKSVSVEF